jgi:hypothetical protein
VFEAMADGVESVAPATAELYRRCAADELALSLIPGAPPWDAPHRLLAGARYLVARGEAEDFDGSADPWRAFHAVLEAHADRLARFVRERPVQTNEAQRSWTLLPLFLTVARATGGRALDLVELGASAGLNLLWDLYGYRYEAGGWGDPESPLQLSGDERRRVPADLLRTGAEVRRRVGIDLHPLDATTEDDMRLLEAYVLEPGYRARLARAAEVAADQKPEVVRGDYLELLPDILRRRTDDTLTVVFQTHSSVYLSDEGRARLRALVDAAGADGPLAWISTPTPEEHGQHNGDYPLELAIWPGGERRIVARTNVRGEWLEWSG